MYLRCHKSLNNKSEIKSSDIKYYDTLPLHQKQVVANLYGREDLVKEIKKQRDKIKRLDKDKIK